MLMNVNSNNNANFNEALSSTYKYNPAIKEDYEKGKPILSVIFSCYHQLNFIKHSLQSIQDQDYQNVELILVDNDAQLDVKEYIHNCYENFTNTALITFEKNQFDWNDVCKEVAVCWNVALIFAKGDYVCHIGHDDLISPNYASSMVNLFLENPECVTAAPMPFSINSAGIVNNPDRLKNLNMRPRYIDGLDVAIDLLEGGPKKLFAAPGEIFVIKRAVMLKHGGYDRIVDISQVLKYAVLGVTGFDSEASLYWRHHDGQLNKQAKLNGAIFYQMTKKGWDQSGIVDLWRQSFDDKTVKLLLAFMKHQIISDVINVLVENIRNKNFNGLVKAGLNILRECPTLLPRAFCVVLFELFSMIFSWTYRRLKFFR